MLYWDSTVDCKLMNVMYVVIKFCYMDLGALKWIWQLNFKWLWYFMLKKCICLWNSFLLTNILRKKCVAKFCDTALLFLLKL
jgi:hypothetical protein